MNFNLYNKLPTVYKASDGKTKPLGRFLNLLEEGLNKGVEAIDSLSNPYYTVTGRDFNSSDITPSLNLFKPEVTMFSKSATVKSYWSDKELIVSTYNDINGYVYRILNLNPFTSYNFSAEFIALEGGDDGAQVAIYDANVENFISLGEFITPADGRVAIVFFGNTDVVTTNKVKFFNIMVSEGAESLDYVAYRDFGRFMDYDLESIFSFYGLKFHQDLKIDVKRKLILSAPLILRYLGSNKGFEYLAKVMFGNSASVSVSKTTYVEGMTSEDARTLRVVINFDASLIDANNTELKLAEQYKFMSEQLKPLGCKLNVPVSTFYLEEKLPSTVIEPTNRLLPIVYEVVDISGGHDELAVITFGMTVVESMDARADFEVIELFLSNSKANEVLAY